MFDLAQLDRSVLEVGFLRSHPNQNRNTTVDAEDGRGGVIVSHLKMGQSSLL